jgi:dienelactone hydrolase
VNSPIKTVSKFLLMIDPWQALLHLGTLFFFFLKIFPVPMLDFALRRSTVLVFFTLLVLAHRFQTKEIPTRWNIKLIYITQIFLFFFPKPFGNSFWAQSVNFIGIILIVASLSFSIGFPRPELPKPKGRKLVGTSKIDLNNELIVKVWYPSDEMYMNPKNSDIYMNPNHIDKFAKVINFYSPFMSHFAFTKTSSFCDIPLSNSKLKYPIIIFSHDLYCIPELYTLYCEFFASNGFIVFGIYHTDGSACLVNFPSLDKNINYLDVAKEDLNTIKEKNFRENQLKKRIENIQFLLDHVFTLNQRFSRENCLLHEMFFGRFDTSNITTIGHSFGGVTAAVASAVEPRITNAVSLDGWFAMFDIENYDFQKPVLFVNSEKWQSEIDKEKVKFILSGNSNSKSFIVKETEHQNFSDVGFLVPTMKVFTNILGKANTYKVLNLTNNLMANFVQGNLTENYPKELIREFN